jgi:serine/threonine-protein kinase HipA
MGALRLSVDGGRTFLGKGTDVPKLVRLPELLSASKSVSAGTDGWEEVKSLLDAGSSSLGGARPKATVADGETLLVAKFPSTHDQWDVIAWEAWAMEMARRANLVSPTVRLERIAQSSVLLERRFDRDGTHRLAYLSGLSALGLKDGAESDYAELGDTLRMMSAAPKEDLEELFGRIVLSIAVHNTDDHLRNHGLLRTAAGWRLSPLFDVNPNPYLEEERALPVFGEAGSGEVEGLSGLGSFLGIERQGQARIVARVTGAFTYWKSVARRLKCAEREISMFSPVIGNRLEALAALT